MQAGELTRGLLLLTSATRCLTVHTVTAPFSKYRGSGSTLPRNIQKSSWKKQVMFHLLLRHRWSHCMSLGWCKTYLVHVNMQTLLSYLVLCHNLCFLCIVAPMSAVQCRYHCHCRHHVIWVAHAETCGLNLAADQEYNAAWQQGGILHREVPQNAAIGVVSAAEKAKAKIQSTGCCC